MGLFLDQKNLLKRQKTGMQKVINFFREAKGELMKVNWPTQKELIRYTVLVVLISLGVAIFLGALDTLFSYLVEKFLLT